MTTLPVLLEVSSAWRSAYPDTHVGILAMRAVTNPEHHPDLENAKVALEQKLRTQFAGQDRGTMATHPALKAYAEYYRRFKKTYHIQLQLESIVWKGKSIPSVAALVEAMFMAEMNDLLLTAGHDLDSLHLPLSLDVATGSERYTLLRGEEQAPKPGDMMISDQEGIISTIIYGPDQRTQITPKTSNVIFTVYGLPNISGSLLAEHLNHIKEYIVIFAPQAEVEQLDIC